MCAALIASQFVDGNGTKAKERKCNVLTANVLNLPPDERNLQEDTLLLGVYEVKKAKQFGGLCRMLTGVDPTTGIKLDEVNLMSDLEQLQRGVRMDIPDDVNGGLMSIVLEVDWLGTRADLLGRNGLGPWTECFQAQHPCSDCWWHSKCDCAHVPRPLLSSQTITHKDGCRCNAPRSHRC
jgi:hypothetical protein